MKRPNLISFCYVLMMVGVVSVALPSAGKSENVPIKCGEKKGELCPGTRWQWQLEGPIDTSLQVDMYDIDLFETPQHVINRLHEKGIVVICYFSAGSWEGYRSDASRFPNDILGKVMDGWPDEKWLDIRAINTLRDIMTSRFDLAAKKGCDGVEPDNVDGYANDTGFPLRAEDQIRYNIWLSREAHSRKLSIGLKNDIAQVRALAPYFDWALNEECFQYDECDALKMFIQAGKAVFGVEYTGDPKVFCPKANKMNFDWLLKNLELDGKRLSCR